MKAIVAMFCGLMLAAAPAWAQDKAKAEEKKADKAAMKAEMKGEMKADMKKADAAKKEPSEAQKKQQQRMTDCNAKAGDKKLEGDARKKYMSSCLKGEPDGPSDKQKAQQDRMKDCNAKAADKKGDERKTFMSSCLKG